MANKSKTLPVAGQIAPALSLDGSIRRRAIRFQSVLPKNHPDQAACWLTLHIERITYRKECLVNFPLEGLIMSIKQLKDGRYQVVSDRRGRKESGFEKSLP